MKQTFNIPDGCKTVSIEQVDNTIVTTFEEVKKEFKKGDFIFCINGGENPWIGIFEKMDKFRFTYYARFTNGTVHFYSLAGHEILRLATESEKQLLLDKMHEAGYDWDAEKMEVIPYKWKPKIRETYFCVDFSEKDFCWEDSWNDCIFERLELERGLIFKTKEEAIECAKKMLNAIKK